MATRPARPMAQEGEEGQARHREHQGRRSTSNDGSTMTVTGQQGERAREGPARVRRSRSTSPARAVHTADNDADGDADAADVLGRPLREGALRRWFASRARRPRVPPLRGRHARRQGGPQPHDSAGRGRGRRDGRGSDRRGRGASWTMRESSRTETRCLATTRSSGEDEECSTTRRTSSMTRPTSRPTKTCRKYPAPGHYAGRCSFRGEQVSLRALRLPEERHGLVRRRSKLAHPFTRVVVAGSGAGCRSARSRPRRAPSMSTGSGLNGAGCPNGWQAQVDTARPVPPGQLLLALGDPVGPRRHGAAGRATSPAPACTPATGARFTGLLDQLVRHGAERRDMGDGDVRDALRGLHASTSRSRARGAETETQLGSLASGGSPYYAKHLWAGVTCASSSCADSASAGRAVQITHVESHAVVEDYTPPGAPDHSAGSRRGWNSGQKAAHVLGVGRGQRDRVGDADGRRLAAPRRSTTRARDSRRAATRSRCRARRRPSGAVHAERAGPAGGRARTR